MNVTPTLRLSEENKQKALTLFLFFSAEEVFTMNQTAGATNAYRRCSKGGKVRETHSEKLRFFGFKHAGSVFAQGMVLLLFGGSSGNAVFSICARPCALEML